MKNKKIISVFGILVGIISLFLVSAIGVGGVPEYIEVYPGQSIDRDISLQNLPAGSGDLTFAGVVEEGTDYVSLIDKNVDILDGEIGKASIKINIPESAKIGDVYNAKVGFSTSVVNPEEIAGGTAVQFNLGTSMSFEMRVIEKPAGTPPEKIGLMWWVLGIIVVVLIIIIVLFISKNKKAPVK